MKRIFKLLVLVSLIAALLLTTVACEKLFKGPDLGETTTEATTPVETPTETTPAQITPIETSEVTTPVETPEVTTPVETPEVTTPVETPEVTTPDETPDETTPAGCDHEWTPATCLAPKTCSKCGETEGSVSNEHVAGADATCTTAQTCALCGTELKAALGHTAGETVVENNVAADCENNGSYDNVVYCFVCGTEISRETITVDALGHTEVVDKAVEATCTTAGKTEGKHCSVCDKVLVAQKVINAFGHSYEAVVTAPTCTEAGFTTYTCSVCGNSYIADQASATGHSYEAVITAPNCTEAGYTTYTCACGDTYVDDEVDALGHDYNTVVTAPDCINGGYTTYTCSACDDTYVADETDALGHNYEAVVTAPTCTEDGYTTYTCSACDDTYVADETDALGHNHVAVVTAPTCTAEGYTTYTCSACNDSYVANKVAALGHTPGDEATCTNAQICTVCSEVLVAKLDHDYQHGYCTGCGVSDGHTCNYEAVVTAPTCTEDGYTTYTCTICFESYVADETDALGHDYDAVVTAPTCTEAGYTTYTCSVCGDTYVADETDALGHDYDAVVTDPDCENGGYTTYTCSVCGDTYVADETDALGHDYDAVVTAPTCTAGGYTTYTCSVCGNSYVADRTNATGHFYEAVTTAPTCTEGGFATYTCSVCDNSYVADRVNALGHSYVASVTAPTCTAGGFTTYTCSVCDNSYVADEVAALGHTAGAAATCTTAQVCTVCGTELNAAIGHDYDAVVTDPTCTEKGYTTHTCANCGDVYVDTYVKENGHTAGAAATCTTAQVCTVCDAELNAAIGHDYDAVVTDPTCTEKGYTTHTCANCGDVYVDTYVKENGHTAGDAATCTTAQVCTVCGTELKTALGHDIIIDEAVDATCTETGLTAGQHCSRCNDETVEQEVVAALGHDYDAVVTDPTCTTVGYTTYTCSVCGHSYVADEVAALGHTAGDAATCTTAQICTVCNVELKAALGHDYDAVVTAPTCTTAGFTTYTCSACEDSYVADRVAALGHDYDAVVTAPTCTAAGFTTYTCACGDSYVADEVVATGHTWVDATCTAPKTCSACGATEGEVVAHQLNNEGTCSACDQNFKRTINFVNADGVSAISGIVGETINLPTPQAANYTFDGWYLDSALTTPFKETTFRENLTLYAKWTFNTNNQITVFSYNVSASGWTDSNGPTRLAFADAGNPDIICLQNAGSAWKTQSFSGYTASYQNSKTEKFLIYYKTDKFGVITSGYTDYLSYIVLQRKSDGASFTVVNTWFNNNTDEATRQKQLEAIWGRVDGIWKDVNRGLMPMIITGSFSASPANSNIYQSLTENSLFVDSSKAAKSILSTNSADTGNYIFASYHMQTAVESYNVLTKRNNYYPIVVKVAFPNTCSHIVTKTEAVDATCLTAGSAEYYTCTKCGKIFADVYGTTETTVEDCVIPALGHKAGADATCETAQTCTRCDYVFKEAIGHAWTNACDTECNNGCGTTRDIIHDYEWVIDTDPTFVTEGVQHEECTVCHDKRNENTPVEKLACTHHFTKTTAIAATCLTAGREEYYTCSICNKVYLDEEGTRETTAEDCILPALGHDIVIDKAVEATCTETGLTTGQHCSRCDDATLEQTVVNALGHDEQSHEAKAPTCTEIGWEAYVTCSKCDYTTKEELDALGHDEQSHEAKAPTCTEIGWEAYVTCSKCDYTTKEELDALGHDEQSHEAKAPTCTEIGWAAYVTCSKCDYTTKVEKDALGHDYQWVVDTHPTFDTDGVKHEECTVCQNKRNENTPIEKLTCTHSLTKTEAVAETCLTAGSKEYYTCSICGKVYLDAEGTLETTKEACVTAALGHDKISHEEQEATCTEKGWGAYETCSRCDYTTKVETDALGHNAGAEVTCTTNQTCTRCDYVYVEAIGHNEDGIVEYVEATCAKEGVVGGIYCTACDYQKAAAQTPIAKVPHNTDGVVEYVSATCTENGVVGGTYCTVCEYDRAAAEEMIGKLGHKAGAEATCTTAQTCIRCAYVYVAALGHEAGEEATCTTAQTCIRCAYVYVEALGHEAGAEATCTTAQICIVCDAELAPALGHSHNAVVTDPTCTASGYTTYICACGDSYVANKVAARGHSYEAVVVAPTCVLSGYTIYTCQCGESYATEEVAATGHTWGDATCTAPKTCSVCGSTVGESLEHQLNGEGVCGTCGQNFKRTIRFSNADGVAAISGIVGEQINLPTPKKSNYTFAGWYLDSACTNAFKGTTYSEDLTLYAKWTSNKADQITVMSYHLSASNWTNSDGPTKKAIAAAGNPDVLCMQNVGSSWPTLSISGYTASTKNKNTNQNVLIYFKTDKFVEVTSGYDSYLIYVVLQRKSDGAQFMVVNARFNNSLSTSEATRQAQLNAVWGSIDGIWENKNYGLMPVIITADFSAASTDSNVYQSLTENAMFSDASNVAMSIPGTNSPRTGDYIFVSYHMQYVVESYNVLEKYNNSYPIVINVALSNACSHKLAKTEAVAPTCTTEGNTEYYVCSKCARTYADAQGISVITSKEYTISALGHKTGADATCTSAQTCTRCDYVFQTALTHVWTNACDTACNYGCGTTREITHVYEWVIDTEPTFELEGVKHEECTICHHTRNQNTPVEKLDCAHHFTKTAAIAATCLTAGTKEYYTCSICGKVYLNEEGSLETTVEACAIPALGHKWVDATCAAPKTCSGCGLTEGETLAHTWKDATCAAPATCSVCGLTDGEPLAHTWKAATCLDPKTCSVCRATEGGLGNHNIDKAGSCTVCAKDFNRTITFRGGKLASGTYTYDNVEFYATSGVVGQTIVFPTPQAINDHSFAGWYLDYACTQPFTQKTFSEDLTLYAKFASNVAQQISIMSFNLKTGNSSSNGDLVVNTILSYKPDVFGVQEADSGWRNKLDSKLGGTYASVGDYRGVSSIFDGNECNAIFYRTDMFKLITSGTKWLSNTPDQKSLYSYTENGTTYKANYYRIMTYVVLERKSDGARFIYVNTHLDNNGDNAHEVAEKIRQAEVDIMMKIIKGLTNSYGNLPVVVTGDFNVIPNNRTAYTAMTQTYGFSDSSKVAKEGDGSAMTYTGMNDDSSKWSIIDYVFVSSGLANSVEEYTVCPAKKDGKWISDHNAIIATIAISK